ncbi:MAG: YbdD/YjiX family protein [Rhizobacter sp.]|nr:YbdD/YjiX family protein [Rhizobacter sp.]
MSRTPPDASVSSGDSAAVVPAGLRSHWRAVCGTCRQIFGIPDYERYLAHAAARHPDGPVLTRDEYFRRAIERRYSSGGMRCC